MRKIIVSMHVTLDGFVAGTEGEMDWINLDDELFDLVGTFTDKADTALYGRNTFQMMDGYWPTAGDEPNASKHDIQHSSWYNSVNKIVISESMKGFTPDKVEFIGDNIPDEIKKRKALPGRDILIFGSPSACHLLMKHQLIDEYWLFVNTVILGKGIPMFADIQHRTQLQLEETKTFSCGVAALHYKLKQ